VGLKDHNRGHKIVPGDFRVAFTNSVTLNDYFNQAPVVRGRPSPYPDGAWGISRRYRVELNESVRMMAGFAPGPLRAPAAAGAALAHDHERNYSVCAI
jgi:hypothetical protein